MREEVLWFVNLMEETLYKNDHKGGWKNDSLDWLKDRLYEEAQELTKQIREAIKNPTYDNIKKIRDEAADVANFAMMIADNSFQLHSYVLPDENALCFKCKWNNNWNDFHLTKEQGRSSHCEDSVAPAYEQYPNAAECSSYQMDDKKKVVKKSSLREACEAVKEDVEKSPQWLKNIYEQNKQIRKFIEDEK